MNGKNKIKYTSFTLSIFVLLIAFGAYQYQQAQNYQQKMESSYERAFYDLIDNVKTIDSSLEKGVHAGTPDYLLTLSSEIWRESTGAKASLSQLPLSDAQIDKLQKYLSQVGDYAYTLTKKVARHEDITDEEQQTLSTLSDYSKTLCNALMTMEEELNYGGFSIEEIKKATDLSENEMPETLSASLQKVEEEFGDYPSLIYDGPFSDHIDQQEASYLKEKAEIGKEEAKKLAASIILENPDTLEDGGDMEGSIPCYTFNYSQNDNLINMSVSKQGGILIYFINGREIAPAQLSTDDALQKAEDFLARLGFENMKQSYYIESEGILTINFAYVQEDYTCYSDLVKVGVAMDTGGIVLFESRGYVMNHTQREILTPKVSMEQAKAKINSRLTLVASSYAIIPTDAQHETGVYEFKCKNSEDRNYIVYINTQTGAEEKILMLIETENGTLTM